MSIHLRRALLALAAVCALAAVPAAPAVAAPAASRTPRLLKLDVAVTGFAVRHHRAVALGTARAAVRGADGRVRVGRRHVTLAVAAAKGCNILHLHLQTLKLSLLGLNVTTSPITLRLTGNQREVLGKLFCRLSSGLKLGKAASAARVARSLGRHLGRHGMHVIGLRTRVTPQASASQSPAPSCQVLKLVLGPLNLDLLGLTVDLYGGSPTQSVTVDITADASGGVLGSLFCQLANTGVTLKPTASG